MEIKTDELVLHVTENIDPEKLDLDKYDDFLDEICGHREFQKEAIRAAIRFLLGEQYKSTEELAKENFEKNPSLKEFYLTFEKLKNSLEFPDKLACTIDLATATGKSWVMYGVAQIMFCEGAIDQVLILCPSTTIKKELIRKFEKFVTNKNFREALQNELIPVKVNPRVIDSSKTIRIGDICIDNVHKTYTRVSSSIDDSLKGKGQRTLILNDESHHIINPQAETSKAEETVMKEWKKFLVDLKYNFKFIVGLSGTPYLGNDYAADVIYRYNIMQAMEGDKAGNFTIKKIEYVQKDEAINDRERFNIVYKNHQDNKKKWNKAKKHITIFVTQTIHRAEILAEKIKNFLVDREKISINKADEKVLVVTSSPKHEKNREILKHVDEADNTIEWIVSVSMLTEGWDVDNVFQIVPHHKRAFDSRLLIAQVLGRGLRVPPEYESEQPTVIIYNHDKWSSAIKDLVYEVMAYEKRVRSYIVKKEKNYNFELYNLNYRKERINVKKHPVRKAFKIPKMPTLSTQSRIIKRKTTYYKVKESKEKEVITEIQVPMYPVNRVVEDIYNKLATFDEEASTKYSQKLNKEELRKKILNALKKIKDKIGMLTEENKNRIERAFDVLKREATGTTTIKRISEEPFLRSTENIPSCSVKVSEFQENKAMIYEESSIESSKKDDIFLIKKARDEAIHKNIIETNKYLFRCPLNIVILSHGNEREFGACIVNAKIAGCIDAWIKNVDRGFYSVPYSYRKGTHQKEANFNPDFFIKIGNDILVIEIKGDEDIKEINKAKLRYADQHFKELNKKQKKYKYYFKFLSPQDYPPFFEKLKKKEYASYISNLEAELRSK